MNEYNEFETQNSENISGGDQAAPETRPADSEYRFVPEQPEVWSAGNGAQPQQNDPQPQQNNVWPGGNYSQPQQSGAWSGAGYVPPQQNNGWSDAGYIPAQEAGTVPKSYACAAPAEKKPKKQRKGAGRAAGFIAACLVCAILGGVVGGALPGLLRNRSVGTVENGGDAEAIVRGDAATTINKAAPSGTNQVVTAQIPSGSEMSATDLYYNLAVNQVVGITGSVNYRYYGRTYSSTVSGSGFIISEDGYILTNSHVIADAAESGGEITVLLYDGSEYTATVVGYDEDNDVGVLKIDATGLMPVTIGDSDSLLVGETVYVVGNAMGYLEWSLTSGLVSGKDREISAYDSANGTSNTLMTFQTQATINSGNSGGPVYNSRGEVVGIATASAASSSYAESLNFAIPINTAITIAEDLIEDGHVHKAFIGIINPTDVTETYAQYYNMVPGVYAWGIQSGSAAEKAGMKQGDIIVALGDYEISGNSDLSAAKKNFRAGDTTTIRVFRSGEYLDLTITFDDEAAANTVTVPDSEQEDRIGSFFGR